MIPHRMRQEFEFSSSGEFVRRVTYLENGARFERRLLLMHNDAQAMDACSAFDQAFLRSSRTTFVQGQAAPSVRVVDLFSGCGGLSLGAREACGAAGKRFEARAALDTDVRCLAVYAKNLSCQNVIAKDIADTIDGPMGAGPTEAERRFLRTCGPVDLLLAGPPCQGNSNLNNHTRRADTRNLLYERVARFVEIALPTHVLIENLPTVVHGKERALQRTLKLLEDLNYSVDFGIVDLAAIGVPQRRMRHVVVASQLEKIGIDDVVANHRVNTPRSVMWAIGDLRKEQRNGLFSSPSTLSFENRQRIKYLHDKKLFDLPNALRPVCHQNEEHSYRSMYGRLRPDEPAQTLTCGFASPGQGRYVHPSQRRTLTPHEAARLQFFPDFFDFSDVPSRKALAKMIGNAVPMKLSYVFCLEFLARSLIAPVRSRVVRSGSSNGRLGLNASG